MSKVFDSEFPRNVSRVSSGDAHNLNVLKNSLIEKALQRTRVLTDDEAKKNVSFDYRGIGITNADSDTIEAISFATHVNDRALTLSTLRVDFRKTKDAEAFTRYHYDVAMDLCELLFSQPSLYHEFIEQNFVEGIPERYKGFDLFWSGWVPIKNGTEVVGHWIAITPDGKQRAYSAAPGGEGFFTHDTDQQVAGFDMEPREGQRPVTPERKDGVLRFKNEEFMIEESRNRLIALIDNAEGE